jgi:hypothetical protein
MPAVRNVTRDAARDNDKFSSIILGIAQSAPFQMRRKAAATTIQAADASRLK